MENKVDFKVFIWAIGLLTLAITWLFYDIRDSKIKADIMEEGFYEIKTEIGVMGANISWMRKSFDKLQENLKEITYKSGE